MDKLNRYILRNISVSFFSIFVPLFLIASIIFLIKLADITFLIKINAFEMFKLYSFLLPDLLFYTLPVTFFLACTLAFANLSYDYELIVIFVLGISPNRILKMLLKVSFLLSSLLLFISIFLIPHMHQVNNNFIIDKRSEINFNLKVAEFGQSFGDWMLFIGKKEKFTDKKIKYKDLVMFNKSNDEEKFIIAESAYIKNVQNFLKLILSNGKAYYYKDNKFHEMQFETLTINSPLIVNKEKYLGTFEYWKTKYKEDFYANRLTTNILFSLFPILSIPLALIIGLVNVRYNRSFIYLYLFLTISLFYGISYFFTINFKIYAVLFVLVIWILLLGYLYKKYILNRY